MNSSGLFFALSVFLLCNWTTESHVKYLLTRRNIRSAGSPDTDSFLNYLFQKYGANGSMDVNQFKELLKEVRIGDKDSSSAKESKTLFQIHLVSVIKCVTCQVRFWINY